MGVGGQRHAPAALPQEKIRYPLYRRLGGPQGRSGRVRKISPLQGFDPRIFQSVTIRYADWAISANRDYQTSLKCFSTLGDLQLFIRSVIGAAD